MWTEFKFKKLSQYRSCSEAKLTDYHSNSDTMAARKWQQAYRNNFRTLKCTKCKLQRPPRVRSENAVRPIGTEQCGTGRAFGKSCRIDLIVLRISERLLPVMMEFQAAAYLSRDPLASSVEIYEM
jgi:hypothetical protein